MRHLLSNAYTLLEQGIKIKMEMPPEPSFDETALQDFKRQKVCPPTPHPTAAARSDIWVDVPS